MPYVLSARKEWDAIFGMETIRNFNAERCDETNSFYQRKIKLAEIVDTLVNQILPIYSKQLEDTQPPLLFFSQGQQIKVPIVHLYLRADLTTAMQINEQVAKEVQIKCFNRFRQEVVWQGEKYVVVELNMVSVDSFMFLSRLL